MRASEIMHTPAVICAPSTTLREAAEPMNRRHVGSDIVIDEVGQVAGIVTDRDIVLRDAAQSRSADAPVDNVMTRNVATVDVHADVADAAATMMKRGVRPLRVTDQTGHAPGLVALDDLIRHVSQETDTVSELSTGQSATTSVEE